MRNLSECLRGNVGRCACEEVHREAGTSGDIKGKTWAMSTDAPALRDQQVLYGIVGDRIDRVTRRVPADEPPPLGENGSLHVIGERLPRLDAIQKVTGRAR